ncbi:hypothetical protein AN958_08858 [Leucoagaricus sp. SymC.cos]|nr:hypothetical protein AN958_08858 [Leucoagaricus sp. SymC.cos]
MFGLCLHALLSPLIVLKILFLSLIPCVEGNTEIINFSVSPAESPLVTFPGWTHMNSSDREILLNIPPVLDTSEVSIESGVWFALDLDDPNWSSYNKFTLRSSWPASHPCDIYLKIHDPLHVVSQLMRNRPLHTTRKKYAHVYVINTGVPTPSPTGEDMTWLLRQPVPITLVLEPLLFGAVPQSVVPTIFVILGAIALALVLLPYVLRHYGQAIREVKQEVIHAKQE